MWGLLATTILTSAADSVNPIAITQQFVLQGMVKKPKHIWFFIIPTGVTNLIGGYLAYFGLIALIETFLGQFAQKYGRYLFTAELIFGIAFLVGVGFMIQNNRLEALKEQLKALKEQKATKESEESKAAHQIKSVSPAALLLLGVGATISELTTALPYFAFLAILFNYQLNLPQLSFILILYNLIYTSPLIILYFVYCKAQDKFDSLYRIIKTQFTKFSNIAAPCVVGVVGVLLIFHSVLQLLK